MVLYELAHIFYRYHSELIHSPKDLGLYSTLENAKRAICYYNELPGFCDNRDAFSIRERYVLGEIRDCCVFEAIVYLHSADYSFESEIELGLYAEESAAQTKLQKYCSDNDSLIHATDLVFEGIVNRCLIDRKQWPEGFDIFEQ